MRLYERATAFSEVGAGVQLGPNVVKLLHNWGLKDALERVAAFPERMLVRDAVSGQELGALPLGQRAVEKYGAPYLTLHRADLHALLLQAVQARENVQLKLNSAVAGYVDSGREVTLRLQPSVTANPELHSVQPASLLDVEGDALIGADGLWSRVRQQMLNDGLPRVTGHLAYRAILSQTRLPARLRSQQVTVWLGPRLHVVHYPVRGGEWLNVVVIVQGQVAGELQSWDHHANGAELQQAMGQTAKLLQDLIQAVTDGGSGAEPSWRLWPLSDRPPMQGAYQQAKDCVALLGDAAHPMRPFLAQGAGMAIEDAAELGSVLAVALDPAFSVPTVLQRYALNRWQRNARVQARSLRNGQIFHAQGPLRWARDASMKLLGEKLLDMPWLYGAAPNISQDAL